MIKDLKVKVLSVKKHHGGKPVRQKRQNEVAVAKLKGLLGKGSKTAQPAAKVDKTSLTKEYGSHSGSTHSFTLADTREGVDLERAYVIAVNAINELGAKSGIDIAGMKYKHRIKRDDLMRKYQDKYGDLSQAQMIEYQNEYSMLSFDYVETQVVVTLYSDEPIEGGKLDTSTQMYVVTIKSKTFYSTELLSNQMLDRWISVDSNTELPVKFVPDVRSGGKFITDHNGQLKLVPANEQTLQIDLSSLDNY